MPAPLLETKLYVPRPRPGLVPRPRLLEPLDDEAALQALPVTDGLVTSTGDRNADS